MVTLGVSKGWIADVGSPRAAGSFSIYRQGQVDRMLPLEVVGLSMRQLILMGACVALTWAAGVPVSARTAPAADPFTRAFVSGVAQVCAAAWSQALTGDAKVLTPEERRMAQSEAFEAGGFLRGVEDADTPNLLAMEAMGVPGKAQIEGPGQVYAVVFGPKPECVVAGFGAPLQRSLAVEELKRAGWTASASPTREAWAAYKSAGDSADTILILRAQEEAAPALRTFRATVIALPRSAIRPEVLDAMVK